MSLKNKIEPIKHSLQLDEDIIMHNRGWQVQQAGIIIIFLVFIVAILGLFGDGVLSSQKIETNNQVLEYQKFGRYQGEQKLTFHLYGTGETVQIAIPASYLDHFKPDNILPEPSASVLQNGQVIYTFKSTGELDISFYLVPEKTGYISNVIQADQYRFSISHFIYP